MWVRYSSPRRKLRNSLLIRFAVLGTFLALLLVFIAPTPTFPWWAAALEGYGLVALFSILNYVEAKQERGKRLQKLKKLHIRWMAGEDINQADRAPV